MLASRSYLTGSNFPVNATVCRIDVYIDGRQGDVLSAGIA
jgi:hypothetical protein